MTGYVFETDMADGCYVAIAERLSPGGCSYLLVNKGRGTLAACLFDRFHDERQYLEATIAFFKRNVGVRWHTAQRYGGTGNYHCVERAVHGNHLYAGEAAGFQDALFGFGLRYALPSGYLAGGADGSALAYEKAWHRRPSGLNAASILNRGFYVRLGDRGRQFLFRKGLTGQDPRYFPGRIYKSAYWKTLIAKCLPSQPLLHSEHFRPGCDCTWCRCQIHASALDEDAE